MILNNGYNREERKEFNQRFQIKNLNQNKLAKMKIYKKFILQKRKLKLYNKYIHQLMN